MQEDRTADPVVADICNFYKVEVETRRDFIDRMLFAGKSLDRAREVVRAVRQNSVSATGRLLVQP